jgi:hypothetical protein
MIAPSPPVTIGPTGSTLTQLGAPPIVLDSAHPKSPKLGYTIMPGGTFPYLRVLMKARVTIPVTCKPGFGYVNMLTDAGASVSIEFEQRCRGGRRTLRWNTVTTYGTKLYSSHGRTASVTLRNYVRLPDAAPGIHGLRFTLQQYEGFRFSRVTVDPSTQLVPTAEPPYTLDAKLAPTAKRVKTHAPVKLTLTLRNTGSRVARHVGVEVLLDPSLRPRNLKDFESHWADIPPGGDTTRSLVVSAIKAGRSELQVAAQSSVGNALINRVLTAGNGVVASSAGPAPPTASGSSEPRPDGRGDASPPPSRRLGIGPAAGVLAVIAAAGVLLVRRRRQTTRS